jgi:hypothetical protein
MENTSKQTSPISRRDVAFYRRRQQNRVFSKIAQFFANEAEKGRITRKEIARRLSKDPAQITRWLSAPSNFELDTISDLLLAMDAELDLNIVRFIDHPRPNYTHPIATATNALTTVEATSPGTRQVPPPPGRTTKAAEAKVILDAPV